MSAQDDDLFAREMAGVTPLADDDRVPAARARADRLAAEARRLAALGETRRATPVLTIPDEVAPVGPTDIVGEKKNGVQEGVYRKLRLGKYEVRAVLDLHRVKVKDACRLVEEFVDDAVRRNLRTVMITHGKGVHSPAPGVMKSYVMHWLAENPLVLAWHSAQPRHGGAGATYVMVRKSPAARQHNREMHPG